MLTLYHAIPSRSSIARWMLEEVGEPYDVQLLDLQAGDNQKPAYLAVNPMGKVPAIDHDGVVVTESAAICTYLADAFPKAGLSVPVGDKRRGPYLKWLFFGPSCIEPAITDRAYPRKEEARRGTLGHGDYDTVIGCAGEGGRRRSLSARWAVHRSRRRHRFGAALGHDVQAHSGAAGVHRLCRPLERTAGAQARAGEGRGGQPASEELTWDKTRSSCDVSPS